METTEQMLITLYGCYQYRSYLLSGDIKVNINISDEGCRLALEYLISDTSFRQFVKEKIELIKERLSVTQQRLNRMFIYAEFTQEGGQVILSFSTVEGAYLDIEYVPRLLYADFCKSAETVRKGLFLKDYLSEMASKYEKKDNFLLLRRLLYPIVLYILSIFIICSFNENTLDRLLYGVLGGAFTVLFIKIGMVCFGTKDEEGSVNRIFNIDDL